MPERGGGIFVIVINILGTVNTLTEGKMQAIVTNLLVLCKSGKGKSGYISFSVDRCEIDLVSEIVVLIHLADIDTHWAVNFGERVRSILEKHLPPGTLIGVQLVEAKTVSELAKEP